MAVLALYSNKGGVGKTATTVNLAYLAAQAGYQTLACDLDPQSSTTYYFRVQPRLKRSVQGLTTAGKPIAKSIKGSDYPKLDLLPADFSHRNLDITFADLLAQKPVISSYGAGVPRPSNQFELDFSKTVQRAPAKDSGAAAR